MYLARRTWTQDFLLALTVSTIVAILIAVTLVGLRWGNGDAQASEVEPVMVINDQNLDQAFEGYKNPDWYKLLYRITVVDFCGELTWHVREGYRIDRNDLQIDKPISIGDAALIRNKAINLVEAQMNRDGVQDYSYWCSEQGSSSADYFRSVWYKSASQI